MSYEGKRVVSEKRQHSGFENRLSGSSRLFALDALRGLIMILMALDHANHFIAQKHSPGEYWGGSFPVYDSPLAFLTRFVTHPVAPGFAFLMGAGMLLFANSRRERGWSEGAILRHFLIRGAFLIALQLLVVNRAWELSPGGFPKVYIGVLVALGGGMILGSLLLRFRPMVLLLVSIGLFIGTELLHPDPSMWGTLNVQPANLLLIRPGGDANLWSNYPILPWLETVVFGILFGHWLVDDSQKAFKRALALGGAFLLGFVILRSLDGFGNIRPRVGDGWMDYLNVVKYPPAMTFTLLTMGLNLILLGLFARAGGWIQRVLLPLVVFGQVPLFFYLLHLFLYAGLGLWLTPRGTTIVAMYPYWLLGLLILFPLCRWYGGFKRRQPVNSILRFL
jgi:uncharacterized membrane protein